jgi:BioD-like phosphotransacetylase family protein
MIINAFGYYKDNLGLQYTAYTAMYQQIKGSSPELKDDDPVKREKTAQALQRIQLATAELQLLEPKLQLLAQGQLDHVSDEDLARLQRLAALYPDQHQLRDDLLLAWSKVHAD